MIKEDIPLFKLDLEGTSPFNKVDREYFIRRGVKNNNIIIPQSAPFYQKSLRMYDKAGKPLVEGTDYELYGIMGKLTQFTAKPVGLFVRILKDEILEGYFDYQVVGNFSKITNEILNMLHGIYEDDRFVSYENITNKPLWFVPEIHQHDLTYQIYGFTDLVRELNRVVEQQVTRGSVPDFMLKTLQDNLVIYIDGYKKVLMEILDSHIKNLADAHGTNKDAIGLGLVDNIATATLEETLEGLRDDLTITPYNAARAAEAASGRNERLLPAASLPLLRYGSDTFIPPTITGSFEGLGGSSKRHGAIIEADGTLLILQARNNGKVKGLYFTRCINWNSKTPYYDFTTYRYLHPTATADGATLDTVINGSNRYIMVVGDSVKNIWYWCETFGTFDPDRHILRRLTGEWAEQDTRMSDDGNYLDAIKNKACVMADENYKEHFCIFQTYTLNQVRTLRPGYAPTYNTGTLFFIASAGHSFNILTGLAGGTRRANVQYTHPIFGNTYVDRVFTPFIPQTVVVDGVVRLKSLDANYVTPLQSSQIHRVCHSYWMHNGKQNQYSFISMYLIDKIAPNGSGFNNLRAFRSTLTITRVGNDYTVKVIPAEGSDTLYNLDIYNYTPSGYQYNLYMKYAKVDYIPVSAQTVGAAMIAPGIIAYSNGTATGVFPSNYVVTDMDFGKSSTAMLLPPHDGTKGGIQLYGENGITVQDQNPIGLGTGFSSQMYLSADSNDFTKGGMMARQNDGGEAYWVFRPMNLLDSNWAHVLPPEQGTYGGTTYRNYRFDPICYRANIQGQLFLNSQLPMPGVNNKSKYRNVFGNSSDSQLLGASPSYIGNDRYLGDGKWIKEASTSVANGVVTFKPELVINMKASIGRNLVPLLASSGLTAEEIQASWSHTFAFNPSGTGYSVFTAFGMRGPSIVTAAVVANVVPTGSPITTNGYTEYLDCTINRVSNTGVYSVNRQLAATGYVHPKFNRDIMAYERLPMGVSVPYRGKVNGVPDTSAFVVAMTTMARCIIPGGNLPVASLLEILADGSQILRMGTFDVVNSGADITTSIIPYYGIGDATPGFNIFEGAAIGVTPYSQAGYIYDNVISRKFETPPVIGMSNILTPQFTVYFQKIENVLLSGKMYNMEKQYINILDQDPSPANKVFWVYLTYRNGSADYVISSAVRPETSTQSLIAKVTTGPTQIDNIIPYNRFSVNGISISAKRQGSSILASSGSVYDIGNTSDILLDNDFIP